MSSLNDLFALFPREALLIKEATLRSRHNQIVFRRIDDQNGVLAFPFEIIYTPEPLSLRELGICERKPVTSECGGSLTVVWESAPKPLKPEEAEHIVECFQRIRSVQWRAQRAQN